MNSTLFKVSFSLTTFILLSGSQADAIDHSQHMHGMSDTVTSTAYLILLTTGFFTGLSHCVGMCGPLVSSFSIQQKQIRESILAPLLMYQVGRITTYVLIGTMTAAIGSSLQLAALGQGWQTGLSIVIGLLMIIIGLTLTGIISAGRWIESARLAKWVSGQIGLLLASKYPAAPFKLGLTNGMLPCGPVYAMALLAATSPSPLHGAAIMLFFGLGTLPAMLSMGFVFARLSTTLRSRLYRFAALLIMLVGLQQILRGLALGGFIEHLHIGNLMLW